MAIRGVEVQLFDANDVPLASTSGLWVAWFDESEVSDFNTAAGVLANAATDASGWLSLDLARVSSLYVGEVGFLVVYKLDGADHKQSLVFASKMTVASITSGLELDVKNPWTRPSNWLAMPSITPTDQKVALLCAVFEATSNFVAFVVAGNYTIDYGDGAGPSNVSSGVTAEKNIVYTNAAGSSDVGIAAAVAVTFTDAGDLVNRTAHGFQTGEKIAFSSITSTTGISTYTTYYVITSNANDFQVSDTAGGAAKALTTNGSGSVYRPQYRQVVITIVPNGGNITSLKLRNLHSTSGLPATYAAPYLDIIISAPYLTYIEMGTGFYGGSYTRFRYLESFSLLSSSLRTLSALLGECSSLQNVGKLVVDSAVFSTTACTFQDAGDTVTINGHNLIDQQSVVIKSVVSTTGLSLNQIYYVRDVTTNTFKLAYSRGGSVVALTTNGSGTLLAGYSIEALAYGCTVLRSLPLNVPFPIIEAYQAFASAGLENANAIDTSECVNMGSLWQNAGAIRRVPLVSVAAATDLSYLFSSMTSLVHVPAINFGAAGVTKAASYLFGSCVNLQSLPTIDGSMFADCASMFNGCQKLVTLDLINTAGITGVHSLFLSCYALVELPSGLDFSGVGGPFNNFVQGCLSLKRFIAPKGMGSSSLQGVFTNCSSLEKIHFGDASSIFFITGPLTSLPSLAEIEMVGLTASIDVSSCKLSSAALDALYTSLGSSSNTVTVTGNFGTTGDTPSIATAKGWTVVG
jgi:hypothetical protein